MVNPLHDRKGKEIRPPTCAKCKLERDPRCFVLNIAYAALGSHNKVDIALGGPRFWEYEWHNNACTEIGCEHTGHPCRRHDCSPDPQLLAVEFPKYEYPKGVKFEKYEYPKGTSLVKLNRNKKLVLWADDKWVANNVDFTLDYPHYPEYVQMLVDEAENERRKLDQQIYDELERRRREERSSRPGYQTSGSGSTEIFVERLQAERDKKKASVKQWGDALRSVGLQPHLLKDVPEPVTDLAVIKKSSTAPGTGQPVGTNEAVRYESGASKPLGNKPKSTRGERYLEDWPDDKTPRPGQGIPPEGQYPQTRNPRRMSSGPAAGGETQGDYERDKADFARRRFGVPGQYSNVPPEVLARPDLPQFDMRPSLAHRPAAYVRPSVSTSAYDPYGVGYGAPPPAMSQIYYNGNYYSQQEFNQIFAQNQQQQYDAERRRRGF
ncbi:hypothetical protein B0T24DRAFT_597983 [Lasiosphaeria ovina]|uniref:Uncharacterized protein n=1 Tax=Lasiosphaeria ovina TaxID=92902 RepID=A0AAE0JXQ7_9PEZI|nr:hypothetical protein B0T24DRAFT_597983 [Lasiosphaeria ovina]